MKKNTISFVTVATLFATLASFVITFVSADEVKQNVVMTDNANIPSSSSKRHN